MPLENPNLSILPENTEDVESSFLLIDNIEELDREVAESLPAIKEKLHSLLGHTLPSDRISDSLSKEDVYGFANKVQALADKYQKLATILEKKV